MEQMTSRRVSLPRIARSYRHISLTIFCWCGVNPDAILTSDDPCHKCEGSKLEWATYLYDCGVVHMLGRKFRGLRTVDFMSQSVRVAVMFATRPF
jgi:hypothetical protein